jgi:hypothetical protein
MSRRASTPATTLHGRWLLIARVAWVVVALLYVGVFISGIPSEFARLQTPCTDAVSCSLIPHLTVQKVQQLKELGLSGEVFAAYFVAIEVAFTALSAAIGTLIFWRRSEDRMALLVSLTLLTFGGAVPLALFTLDLSPSGRQRQERRLLSALHRRSSSSTSSPTGTSCPAGRAGLGWRR